MTAAARRAVVTGGGRGIGRATAAALTRAGHEVTVLGRSVPALEETVAAGDAAAWRAIDVTDEDALAAASRRASRSTSSSTMPASPTARPSSNPTSRSIGG